MHRLAAWLPAIIVLSACAGPVDAPRAELLGAAPAPRRVRLALKGRAQRRSLSCESRSAVDLLRYYGIVVTEEAFLASLPRSDNPNRGFVGDVDGPGGRLPPAGYGVHAAPVAERLRAYGLPVEVHAGSGLAWLRAQLAAGRPVIVWATSLLDAPTPVARTDTQGSTYMAVRGEHTFLAIGYGRGTVILVDAASGKEKRVFDARFDASWATLGRMAVVPLR